MKINYVSLCSGYGAECIAFKRLKQAYPDFDFECLAWSEIEPSAIKAHDAIHSEYAGRNLNDLTRVDWKVWYESIGRPHIDLLFASTPCFIAGTLVHTSRGYIPIENVTVGDMVLSHTNTYQKVINVGHKPNASILKVRGTCLKDIICTPNHPFYVRKRYRFGHKRERRFKSPEWIEAKDLSKDCYLGYAVNQESKIPQWNGAVRGKNGLSTEIVNTIGTYLEKPSFWYVMGRYLGDGWTRNDKTHKAIVICCSDRNIKSLQANLDKLGWKYTLTNERTTYRFTIYSVELVEFVSRYGYGASNKSVDIETINLPEYLLLNFINGYIDADGHFDKKEQSWGVTSVSERLIYGMQQCITKVYKCPVRMYWVKMPDTTIIEGRVVNQKDFYRLVWHTDRRKQDKAFYEDGYVWFPIKDVTNLEMTATVYNMEVNTDNSYTANGAIVHNCQSVSTAGKQAGMKKGTDAESALIWATESCIVALQPDVIIYENVKGMISKRNKQDFDDWCATLENLGYIVQYKVLNSKDFGIPQNRERVFPIAIRKDLPLAGNYNYPQGFPLEKCVEDIMVPLSEVPEDAWIDPERVTAKVVSDILDQPNVYEELLWRYHVEEASRRLFGRSDFDFMMQHYDELRKYATEMLGAVCPD